MMSTTDPIFPPEIINQIIEEVDGEQTLKTCSTVSLSFCDPAQKWIFRSTVIFFPTSHCDRNLAMDKILASNSWLCSYVESLIVIIREPKSFGTCFGPLPQFPQLNHMTLDGGFASGVFWTHFPGRFKNDVQKIIQSATLRVLEIRNIHELPISTLRPCFHLDVLHIWWSSVSDAEPDTTSSFLTSGNTPEQVYHHALRLDGIIYSPPLQSALSDLASPLYFASLEQLRTYLWHENDFANYQDMLNLIDGSDIEKLELF